MNKKILCLLISIVLIVCIVLGIVLIRKHIIIQELRNNLSKYKSLDNYYVKETCLDEQSKVVSEIYKKQDDYHERIQTFYNNDLTQTCDIYSINGELHKYIIAGDNKAAILDNNNENEHLEVFCDLFDITNKWDYFMVLCNIKIVNDTFNNKECYSINLDKCIKYMDDSFGNLLLEENEKIEDYKFDYYIEKDTGLIVKTSIGPYNEYEYKFDVVKDEDLVQPDISEYTIMN